MSSVVMDLGVESLPPLRRSSDGHWDSHMKGDSQGGWDRLSSLGRVIKQVIKFCTPSFSKTEAKSDVRDTLIQRIVLSICRGH